MTNNNTFSKLTIIIPAYNEESTIEDVLSAVTNVKLPYDIKKQILVVNDKSTDRTGVLVANYIKSTDDKTIQLINHDENKGKGASIQSAIPYIEGDLTIFQDADLELDPNQIGLIIDQMVNSGANVVYGNRFANAKEHNRWSLYYIINRFLTRLSNLKTGLRISDMECCYKLIQTELLKSIELQEKGFGIEPEITAKLRKLSNSSFSEHPITYQRRSYNDGKKIGWKDGVRTIYCILKY